LDDEVAAAAAVWELGRLLEQLPPPFDDDEERGGIGLLPPPLAPLADERIGGRREDGGRALVRQPSFRSLLFPPPLATDWCEVFNEECIMFGELLSKEERLETDWPEGEIGELPIPPPPPPPTYRYEDAVVELFGWWCDGLPPPPVDPELPAGSC
jgi:hypothetical protein